MLIRNTALYTPAPQHSLIKLYPVHAPHSDCCGSLWWETLNGQMQHVTILSSLRFSHFCCSLFVVWKDISSSVRAAWPAHCMAQSISRLERERERVGSVKSPNMWRNTRFHMNIKFFSLDVCIICKYWNIWPSVKSERPVVILSLSLSLQPRMGQSSIRCLGQRADPAQQ